eukprot:861079_1
MRLLAEKNQRQCLVFGFIRYWCDMHTHIPDEIQQLCYKYYNDLIYWTLRDDTLQAFFTKHFLSGPRFTVYNIPFQLQLYPNGRTDKDKGYVAYVLTFIQDQMPSYITDFSISIRLFCSVTNVEWRGPFTMQWANKYQSVQWHRYNMKLQHYNMRNLEQITFGCRIELFDIKYKAQTPLLQIKRVTNNTLMRTKHHYEWIINDIGLLNAFQSCDQEQAHYSPCFNGDCFCIMALTKRIAADESWMIKVGLKPLKLPVGVEYVVIEYTLRVRSQSQQQIVDIFCTKQARFGCKKRKYVYSQKLTCFPTNDVFFVSILASIQILSAFDEQGTEIERQKWSHFNLNSAE